MVVIVVVLAWVAWGERLPPASVGLRRPDRATLAFGIAGIAVNLAISVGVGALNEALGLHEAQSALMDRLLAGPGWLLVLVATNGVLLTEIAFRAYVLERLPARWGRVAQIAVTTALFAASRGLAHGLIWLVDDLVFTAFYLRRRDTLACIAAHGVPNLVATTLVATGLAT